MTPPLRQFQNFHEYRVTQSVRLIVYKIITQIVFLFEVFGFLNIKTLPNTNCNALYIYMYANFKTFITNHVT